jgi:hypothetical protein
MRLWSVHPKYLDAKGLVALWREALLAQAVLRGRTRGYRHHPQLERFRAHPRPVAAIRAYLAAVQEEASRRGYAFDTSLIGRVREVEYLNVTTGQLGYEWRHLKRKLRARAPQTYRAVRRVHKPESHPLFSVVSGRVCDWERR